MVNSNGFFSTYTFFMFRVNLKYLSPLIRDNIIHSFIVFIFTFSEKNGGKIPKNTVATLSTKNKKYTRCDVDKYTYPNIESHS